MLSWFWLVIVVRISIMISQVIPVFSSDLALVFEEIEDSFMCREPQH